MTTPDRIGLASVVLAGLLAAFTSPILALLVGAAGCLRAAWAAGRDLP